VYDARLYSPTPDLVACPCIVAQVRAVSALQQPFAAPESITRVPSCGMHSDFVNQSVRTWIRSRSEVTSVAVTIVPLQAAQCKLWTLAQHLADFDCRFWVHSTAQHDHSLPPRWCAAVARTESITA